jgi:hypothetical protein
MRIPDKPSLDKLNLQCPKCDALIESRELASRKVSVRRECPGCHRRWFIVIKKAKGIKTKIGEIFTSVIEWVESYPDLGSGRGETPEGRKR